MPRQISKTFEQIEAEQALAEQTATSGKRDDPKKLVVVRQPIGLYAIAFTAGGEVPDALKGTFTSTVRAQTAIDLHLAGRLV